MARKSQGPPTNRRQTIAPPPVALVLSWGEGAIRIREPAMERGGTTQAPRHQETRDGRGAWWAPPPRARVPPASLPVIWIRLALPHPPPTTRRRPPPTDAGRQAKHGCLVSGLSFPVDAEPLPIQISILLWQGSSAVEQGTHKPLVGGSNPPLATSVEGGGRVGLRERPGGGCHEPTDGLWKGNGHESRAGGEALVCHSGSLAPRAGRVRVRGRLRPRIGAIRPHLPRDRGSRVARVPPVEATNGPPSSGAGAVKATSGTSLGRPASGNSLRSGWNG